MQKEFKAIQRYLLMSPRKIRQVVSIIKKMKPAEAVEKLPFVQKRAAKDLAKVIKNAIASAKIQGISEEDLVFKEIQVGEGPRLKRGIPVSRGRWHPIKKKMAHIRVILTTRSDQATNSKLQISSNKPRVEKVEIKNEKSEKRKGVIKKESK